MFPALTRPRPDRGGPTDGQPVAAAPAQATTAPSAREEAPLTVVPFVRGSRERTEPFHDRTTTMTTSTRQVGPEDVLAHGFMRHLAVHVTVSGGDDTDPNAAGAEDSPFNVIGTIELLDVNGNPIVQLSGYELFLANKYGAYSFMSDARKSPVHVELDTDGNGGFFVRVPVEISGRDALGALKNQNAGQTYKLRYTIAPSTEVYGTVPDTTLPDVRVRAWLESWTQPRPTDLFGNPVAALPPAHGTMQFWTTFVANVDAGAQTIRLPRVGNHIRTLIAVFRNTSDGLRSTLNLPTNIELTYDGNVIDNVSRDLLRHRMAERYDLDGSDDAAGGLDTGVIVWDWSHDLDGRPGHEMRDLYLPTTQATELALRGTFGAAGRLTVVTNDVAAAGAIYAG